MICHNKTFLQALTIKDLFILSLTFSVHEDLLANGILRPLTSRVDNMRKSEEGTQHFVAPKGSASIPKYFLSKSGLTLFLLDFHLSSNFFKRGRNYVICMKLNNTSVITWYTGVKFVGNGSFLLCL